MPLGIVSESSAYTVKEDEHGTVLAFTIDELSPGLAMFIVKIDIEGAERALFWSNGRVDRQDGHDSNRAARLALSAPRDEQKFLSADLR